MKTTNIFRRQMLQINLLCLFILTGVLSGCSFNNKKNINLPDGWHLNTRNAVISNKIATEKKNGYRLNIDRKVSDNPKYVWYVTVSESIYPNRDKIQTPKLTKKRDPVNLGYFKNRWWSHREFDIKIPYAITKDTFMQYHDYYKQFKKKLALKKRNSVKFGSNEDRVDFSYEARVIDEWEEKKQITVVLKMAWFHYCGMPCGFGFEKERRVTFTDKYTVSKIEGDAPVTLWKSDKNNLYAKEWFRF